MSAGVSAGTGVMSSLLGKLSALLGDEYKLLKGVRKEVEFLKRELGTMNALLVTLADAEKLDPLAKDWRDKVRELSYDLEDCIDIFMYRLGSGRAKSRFMRKTMGRLKTLWTRHEIASQIQNLKARVEEESKRRQRYRLDSIISKPGTMNIDPRLPVFFAEAKGWPLMARGIKSSDCSWTERKSSKSCPLLVVEDWGKTTLAMEVCHKIGGNFQCQAVVSVSSTLDLKKLLKDMLYQIDQYEYSQSEMWDEEQLVRRLRHILEGRRYLIFIDDVWRIHDWKFVASTLPENNNCSRIIVTIRITAVAKSCCSNLGEQIHDLEPLDYFDSRRLFLKRIFRNDGCCPAQLEEVSHRILKKCGGLPLAIITLASLLASKTESMDQWELVLHSISSTHEDGSELEGLREILLFSYHDLPYYLKTCLLYLSMYPEDSEIDRVQLTWRWIAEGLVTEKIGQTLEQISDGYFNELVNRSLIRPIEIGIDGTARACRIHDMVLDLITFLAIEENFVTMLDTNKFNLLPEKIRRLSLHNSYEERHGVIEATTRSKMHVRSLCAFGSIKKIPELFGFHALRVLDFDGCEWLENHHIKNIGGFFQLRYLRFRLAKISKIPT
uniref:Uncharacterized protein n=1 Tax=Avena sativa TaxID=4498 RepID=A0ACD6A8W6_AVESA